MIALINRSERISGTKFQEMTMRSFLPSVLAGACGFASATIAIDSASAEFKSIGSYSPADLAQPGRHHR
jgi:hypothetical protein